MEEEINGLGSNSGLCYTVMANPSIISYISHDTAAECWAAVMAAIAAAVVSISLMIFHPKSLFHVI